jgi:Arc/MetJ-type ribon-helix-helix transcriptional regulator
MREKTKPVSVKLTPTERKAIMDLIQFLRYESVSHVLREGLRLLLEKHSIKEVGKKQIESERRIHKPRHGPMRRPVTESAIL